MPIVDVPHGDKAWQLSRSEVKCKKITVAIFEDTSTSPTRQRSAIYIEPRKLIKGVSPNPVPVAAFSPRHARTPFPEQPSRRSGCQRPLPCRRFCRMHASSKYFMYAFQQQSMVYQSSHARALCLSSDLKCILGAYSPLFQASSYVLILKCGSLGDHCTCTLSMLLVLSQC